MSARISLMYKRSGGCNVEHTCGECSYYAESGIKNEHICKRQESDDAWDGKWMACKYFTDEEIKMVETKQEVKEEVPFKTDEIVIDPELSKLMPPLDKEEYEGLEKLIVKEGCKVPLDVWKHEGKLILVDGHNRHNICRKRNIPYKTNKLTFENKSQVILWMIDTQCGRRNLKPYDRTIMALKYEEVLSEEAEKNLHKATGGDRKSKAYQEKKMRENINVRNQHPQISADVETKSNSQKTDLTDQKKHSEPAFSTPYERVSATVKREDLAMEEAKAKKKEAASRETRERVAKLAGVSRDTVAKVKEIEKKATPKTKELVRTGQLSINQAYNSVHPKKPKVDIVAEAKKEHEAFQQKKAENKVDFKDIKADKDNQKIINTALLSEVLKLFNAIDQFGLEHKPEELKGLSMMVKEGERPMLIQRCDMCQKVLEIIKQNL